MAEEDTMAQDMMGMMMVIMMVAVLSQMIPGAALAAPPTGNVTVTLRVPPSGADVWLMNIIDHSISYYQSSGAKDITEPAAFVVEQDWFPLRIEIRIVGVGGVVIYHIQSFSTVEPNHKDISLYAYGDYYFDVDLEAFTTA